MNPHPLLFPLLEDFAAFNLGNIFESSLNKFADLYALIREAVKEETSGGICVVSQKRKIGIIICDRYHDCAGGKCFRALRNREGAFSIYKDQKVKLVGYATCGGCPGGNVEYCVEEMKKNGAEVVHFATGMVVGYPPCPHMDHFKEFVKQKYGVDVVIGTHPIPQSYYNTHTALRTWDSKEWKEKIRNILVDESMRLKYS